MLITIHSVVCLVALNKTSVICVVGSEGLFIGNIKQIRIIHVACTSVSVALKRKVGLLVLYVHIQGRNSHTDVRG